MIVVMWHPTMLLFCLIAALSGTPLRQAEAAEDFARSFGEGEPGNGIETVDGGVGDDSDVSVLKSGGATDSLTVCRSSATAVVTPVFPPLSLATHGSGRGTDLSDLSPARHDRRFAWLQRFRF